jgi:rhodanese-related sulfurtransferase
MFKSVKYMVLAAGVSLAAVSAEAGFGDLLKAVAAPSANPEPEANTQQQVAKPAANACPKCNGQGTVSRGLKTKKCKECGGTGVLKQKQDDEEPESAAEKIVGGAEAPDNVAVCDDITAAQLKALLAKNRGYLLLDVREPDEFASGHISGAVNVPVGQIERRMRSVCVSKGRAIYVYCQSGKRSKVAARKLANMGYGTVHNVLGGLNSWNGKLVR